MSAYPQVKDFFLIGKTLKSHGTAGQLRVMLEEKFKGYIQKGIYIFLDIDGSKVPFKVMSAQDAAHFVISLKGVQGKDQSDALGGKELWMETELIKPRHQNSPRSLKEKWADYTIKDEATSRSFIILRTEEFPQQLMAVVELDGKELLIPMHEDLIAEIDKAEKIIHMTIPEGLLEL